MKALTGGQQNKPSAARRAVNKVRQWSQRRHQTRREEGQNLLEAAVAFMFLLIILLVMFEMVMVFSSYISLLNCSVQGAVYAAAHPVMSSNPPDTQYQEYASIIQAEALAGSLSWIDVVISPPELPTNLNDGEPLTVTVSYSMSTFATEIIFAPFAGKFGLPSRYYISARTAVPIRGGPY